MTLEIIMLAADQEEGRLGSSPRHPLSACPYQQKCHGGIPNPKHLIGSDIVRLYYQHFCTSS